MRLFDALRSGERGLGISTVDDYAKALSMFGYAGVDYGVSPYVQAVGNLPALQQTMPVQHAEPIPDSFVGYVQAAYKSNGVIFACMLARQLAFSSVRFTWQRLNVGKPSELFGTQALSLLETPWVGGTTQDLLTRTIQDADLAGNSYWTERAGQLIRLRPDWVYIIAEPIMVPGLNRDDTERQIPAQLGWNRLGYVYVEGGLQSGNEPVFLWADEVVHFAPIPDPTASFRGMSWLTPIIRELQADKLMTDHRVRFFENGATPNMVVKHAEGAAVEKVRRFVQEMEENHTGVANAYKTLHLYPGADATVVGANLKELEFKVTQGGGETRIAAAARVPPIIVGLSEGLAAATYSNYGQARRAFADGTLHPLWGNAAGSFSPLLRQPREEFRGQVRLWYDARDVPLLREDAKEAAQIGEIQARTIRTLVDGGYTPDSAMRAVISGDYSLLQHTGLFSVQLQKPGTEAPAEEQTQPVPEADPAAAGETDPEED